MSKKSDELLLVAEGKLPKYVKDITIKNNYITLITSI